MGHMISLVVTNGQAQLGLSGGGVARMALGAPLPSGIFVPLVCKYVRCGVGLTQ